MAADVPVLETQRLILRGWRESDTAMLAALYGDEHNAAHIGGVRSPEIAWRMGAAFAGHWQFRGYGFWCLERRDTGIPIGFAGLWYPAGWPEPELGYSLLAREHGHGFASEAAVAALRYAYTTLGWTSAISLIDADNVASQNVARKLHAIREKRGVKIMDFTCDIWRHQPAAKFLERNP